MSKTPSFSKKVNDFDGENRGIRNFPIMFGERIHLAAYERTLKDNLSILDKYESDARAALQQLTAADRGKEALTKEVSQMQEEERRKLQLIERKKSVLEAEKERASKLISKDPPIPLSVKSLLLNENYEDVDSGTENRADNAQKSSLDTEDDKENAYKENLLSEMQAEEKQAQLKEWNAKVKKRFNTSLRKDRQKKEYDETIKVLENAERFKRRQFAQQLSSNKEMWYPCDQADRLKNSDKQVRMRNAVETALKVDGKYKSKEHAIDELEGYKDLLVPNVKNVEFDLNAKEEKLLACVPKFIQKNYQYLLEEEKSGYVFGQNLDESSDDAFNTAYIESPPYEKDEKTGDDLEEVIKKLKERRSELLSRYEEELISDDEDKHGKDKYVEVKHGKNMHGEDIYGEDKHGEGTHETVSENVLVDKAVETETQSLVDRGISTDKHVFYNRGTSTDRHLLYNRGTSTDRHLLHNRGTSTDTQVSKNKGILTDIHVSENEGFSNGTHALKGGNSTDRHLFEDNGTATNIHMSMNKGTLSDIRASENEGILTGTHAFKGGEISTDRHLFENRETSTDTLLSKNKGILTNEFVSENKGILTDQHTFEEKDSVNQTLITLRRKRLYSRSTQVDLNNAGFLAEARASKPRYMPFQEVFENNWPDPSHPNGSRSEPESWASSSYCSLPSQHGMPKFSDQVKFPNQKCDLCIHEKEKAHKTKDRLVQVIAKTLPLQNSQNEVELISDSNLRDESMQVNSAEYLKTIAEKYFPMKALQIATVNPVVSNCAVPLSEPIRIRPIVPDTVQLNDVNTYSQPEMHLQSAKPTENIQDNGKNAVDILYSDSHKPSHASSQFEAPIFTNPKQVDGSKCDSSGLTSPPRSIGSIVDEPTIKESDKKKILHQVISNYLPIMVNHDKSPPSNDQDSPSFDLDFDVSEYVYHDLSTIPEVDSLFINSTLHQSTNLHQNTPPEYTLPSASLVNGPPSKIIEASKNIHFESTTPIPFHKDIVFDFKTPSQSLVPRSVIITGDNSTLSSPAESLQQHTIKSSISTSSIPNSVTATPEEEFPIQSSKPKQVFNDVSNSSPQVSNNTRFPSPQSTNSAESLEQNTIQSKVSPQIVSGAYILKQSYNQTISSAESLKQYTIQSNDSPKTIGGTYVSQQNLDQTTSSVQSLEQHTIQSNQSPLKILSANKLLKDARYSSLGLKNVITQDSNCNRDAYIPKQSFDQITSSAESLVQHTIQSNDSPIQILSDFKLVKETECRPVDSTCSSYIQLTANDNKDIKIAKYFGNRDAYITKQGFDQTTSSAESLEQHTIQSNVSSVDIPVHRNQSKYMGSHPVHSQENISHSQSKLLCSGLRQQLESSSGVFKPMIPCSNFSTFGSSSNSSSGVFKSMKPYSDVSSTDSASINTQHTTSANVNAVKISGSSEVFKPMVPYSGWSSESSSNAIASSESENGNARSNQWMPAEAALKADYQVKRPPGFGSRAWENQPSTSKQTTEQTTQQHTMLPPVFLNQTQNEEYRVTTPVMGSSDENLSEMFSGSRIAFQSTPIRTVEELAQEDGIMEEPDLTLVSSEMSSTVTTPEKFRNQSASNLKHDGTIDSLLSQLRNASHQQERKEISKSDFSSNVAIKTTLHVQDTKIRVQENVSDSMISFLQHEISCSIETCSSGALYEENANQLHTQFSTHSGGTTHSTDTSDNTHSSNPSENVYSDSQDLPETMSSSTRHVSSLNTKSDFKTRTKRLWHNLEEVKQKKLSDEKQKKMALSRKKMKEYSQKISKNKLATPRK